MDDFTKLTPEFFLPALEEALGKKLTPVVRPFSSYINRVYEVQTVDEELFVAKFYRPGRWTIEALRDEHAFIFDCAEMELPVVCPLKLGNGSSLAQLDEISFAVFPKRAGRQFDIESNDSWQRVGVLLGRLHNAGKKQKAPARITLTPNTATKQYVDFLLQNGVPENRRQAYQDICYRIISAISPYFEGMESLRIHGDFHPGNILTRPDTGLMVIDFDDMMNGPPVQDFWLLLPDHYPSCKRYLDLLFAGYRQFRDIDPRSPMLIEGLRAMRMIYFTSWCNMQRNDFAFQMKFPNWGSDSFWAREIQDLHEQYANMTDAFEAGNEF
jgi:Ser/Thr protein kinase RdoA (MazF antagonist)